MCHLKQQYVRTVPPVKIIRIIQNHSQTCVAAISDLTGLAMQLAVGAVSSERRRSVDVEAVITG